MSRKTTKKRTSTEGSKGGQPEPDIPEHKLEVLLILKAMGDAKAFNRKTALTVQQIAKASGVHPDDVSWHLGGIGTSEFAVLPVIENAAHKSFRRYYIETDGQSIEDAVVHLRIAANSIAKRADWLSTLAEAMKNATHVWALPSVPRVVG